MTITLTYPVAADFNHAGVDTDQLRGDLISVGIDLVTHRLVSVDGDTVTLRADVVTGDELADLDVTEVEELAQSTLS